MRNLRNLGKVSQEPEELKEPSKKLSNSIDLSSYPGWLVKLNLAISHGGIHPWNQYLIYNSIENNTTLYYDMISYTSRGEYRKAYFSAPRFNTITI